MDSRESDKDFTTFRFTGRRVVYYEKSERTTRTKVNLDMFKDIRLFIHLFASCNRMLSTSTNLFRLDVAYHCGDVCRSTGAGDGVDDADDCCCCCYD